MKFGPLSTQDAHGAILAHSLKLTGGTLRKGTVLGSEEIALIGADNIAQVTVAKLENGDFGEDAAAVQIGERLRSPGLRLGDVFTGRINLIAETAGVVRIDTRAIAALNAIDEGLTIATVPDLLRVEADQLIATVKVIPYGLPKSVVEAGTETLTSAPVALHPFHGGSARLVMTRTPGFKESLLDKGEAVVRNRLESLGYSLDDVTVTDHAEETVAAALRPADLLLILGASATSDRYDVAPAAVVRAGGYITRFGMPVDPGNLLFLGDLGGAPVVGLPGCARSPALNGVDWVLERLSAHIPVTSDDIAAMGIGGLLKEMTGRPQPRRPK